MKRLFTFGCSFTRYAWPTWANIIGREFDQFENWGLCGGGNQYIFNSLVECITKNKVTGTDTVIIMWTNIHRQDGYINGHWTANGNLKNPPLVNDYRGVFIRDCAYIEAAKRILNESGCAYQFHSMVPIKQIDQFDCNTLMVEIDDVYQLYKDSLDLIRTSFFESIANQDWYSMPDLVSTKYFFKFPLYKRLVELEKKYNKFIGDSWPLFNDYLFSNIKEVDDNIIKEIDEYNFKQEFNQIKKLLKQQDNRKYKVDPHPMPLTHLAYVQKMMPEFTLTAETIAWTKQAHETLQENKFFEFNEHLPSRL